MMARTVDLAAHAQRRQSFLEAAARQIERKGYEQMTVQDVLDDVGQSKGAFYHYFESKQDLTEALLDHLSESLFNDLERHARAPGLSGLERLRGFFLQGAQLKLEQRKLLTALMPMWARPGNALIRDRLLAKVRERLVPLLGEFIAQGVEDGVFSAPNPVETARMLFALNADLNILVIRALMSPAASPAAVVEVERALAAYNDGVERLLGAAPGSLGIYDPVMLKPWLERLDQPAAEAPVPVKASAGR